MKRITVILDDDVHKAAKIEAVTQDKSLIQYVAGLIEKDVKKEKEQTH